MASLLKRATVAIAGSLALFAIAAGSVSAHVQVEPTVAAPEDAVAFTFLVPGERDSVPTTKVEIAIPPGVLPFSYEDPPDWERRLVSRPDGTVERIVWSGRLAPDGFIELRLLASTPPRVGPLTWKALQHYDDGEVARWIGAPDSENPAPVTEISADAAGANAGGESAGAGPSESGAGSEGDGGGTDWVARGAAFAALALALAAFIGGRRRGPSESGRR